MESLPAWKTWRQVNQRERDRQDTLKKPVESKHKISKFAKAQQPQDDAAKDPSGRKALEQLSSNSKMKSAPAIRCSKIWERVSDSVDN